MVCRSGAAGTCSGSVGKCLGGRLASRPAGRQAGCWLCWGCWVLRGGWRLAQTRFKRIGAKLGPNPAQFPDSAPAEQSPVQVDRSRVWVGLGPTVGRVGADSGPARSMRCRRRVDAWCRDTSEQRPNQAQEKKCGTGTKCREEAALGGGPRRPNSASSRRRRRRMSESESWAPISEQTSGLHLGLRNKPNPTPKD